MDSAHPISEGVARELILDELLDLTLYRELSKFSSGETKRMLDDLILVEVRHHAFWEDFFKIRIESLDAGRRIKLRILVAACRVFGETAVHLTLEAIEIYGIRKYLSIWETCKDTPMGRAVREILDDELQHEDVIVSGMAERKINPDRIRNIFLGLNVGLVEMLGAVSGLFAAFNDSATILMASGTVAVAGAISMAAGVYSASNAEREVRRLEAGKARFLKGSAAAVEREEGSWLPALLVGASYFLGAAVPILPVLFGARNLAASVLISGCVLGAFSFVLAFLSGMEVKKRVAASLTLLGTAVCVTYAVSSLAKSLWGIAV